MPLSEFPAPVEEPSGDEAPLVKTRPPGPMSRAAAARLERVECPSFAARRDVRATATRGSVVAELGDDHAPIVLSSGRGANLFDVDGNRYVDLAAGFGSVLLGHGSPAVTRAIEAQSDRIVQGLGDVYVADPKIALLERLVALHPSKGARALVTQSGSDAVTAALKTAALATGKPGVVAFEGAYHGLGYGPLASCGLRASYREPFAAQLNAHARFAPYPRVDADVKHSLEVVEAALRGGDVGALLVEPVLGRGGCVVPPAAFLPELGALAKRHGALVIADEIWTGLGRTGSMVRSRDAGLEADLLCFGKGLGGGLPISACVGSDEVMQAWARGGEVVHTSTHAGWPLAAAAAVATLDALRFRGHVARAAEVGARWLELLRSELGGAAGVVEARGVGLMIGVELYTPVAAAKTAASLLELGYVVLTGGAKGETLTLTPALTISEELLSGFARALRQAVP
ncbi:MAG TPA: aspartate aminotransferase family protein [Byssovorax sp.]|jgi:4-aminobutyrate aminotransferase/(S)-3-amino-2-methylpropionate transaminase